MPTLCPHLWFNSGPRKSDWLLGCSPWELHDHQENEHLRDEAEGIRIAYVAATRARDLLVVPSVGDGPMSGWVGSLNKALYPTRGTQRRAEVAAGCPEFGESSVLDRPAQLMGNEESSVRPGLHQARSGNHRVVWWDPACLKLDVSGNFGIRAEEILTENKEHTETDRSLDDYKAWKQTREELLEEGAHTRVEVFTATDSPMAPPVVEEEIQIVRIDREKGRPRGSRFGTLVHLILRDAPLDASEDTLLSLAVFHARGLDATRAESDAGIRAVSRALQHPLIRRAHEANETHREFPITLKTNRGPILEGVIDLAFLEGDKWCVVDFKTDTDIESKLHEYSTQVGWYAYAMTEVTGLSTNGYLLGV